MQIVFPDQFIDKFYETQVSFVRQMLSVLIKQRIAQLNS